MQLPEEFVNYTRKLMGNELFQHYLDSFSEEAPVSIRLNPLRFSPSTLGLPPSTAPVQWCPEGYYLRKRPNFTMDPLLHAGCYYVQEAASMFVSHVLRQYVHTPVVMLDLCAAPGGKSTAAIASLPQGSTLYSNEPNRNRANILLENITKWGYPNCIVTNNYPKDYRASKLRFDVILCDVPCSGEGMFRRDEATIGEWSKQNVERCWQLQRDIVSDAWTCLCDGGLLIYSTCTFNTKENEENVRWICEEFDAEVLPVDVRPEWNITGSLLPDFSAPVYRFIPGITRSEGLFVCVIRKKPSPTPSLLREGIKGGKHSCLKEIQMNQQHSYLPHREGPEVGLSYPQAIAYLRGEALTLPADTPRGIVTVTFQGHPLGMMKNIGTRANNLYPKEWRIRTTHVPHEYQSVL